MNQAEATTFVTNLYHAYLGREPDADGFNWWVGVLVSNSHTPANVTAAFSTSAEAVQYTQLLQTGIQNIYKLTLGRVASGSEISSQVAILRAGSAFGDVFDQIFNSQAAIQYRATHSEAVIAQQDSRIGAMRIYNAAGNAIVDYRPGDSFHGLAYQAYGATQYWYAIAMANKCMTDIGLSLQSKIIIPNVRLSSLNPHAVMVSQDAVANHYYHRALDDYFLEYVTPISSQLEGQYEENPNWYRDVVFVDGGEYMRKGNSYFARVAPNPNLSPAYLQRLEAGLEVLPEEVRLPVNTEVLQQLPVFYSSEPSVSPPPPPVFYTPGSNPAVGLNAINKYPDQIQTTIKNYGISIVTVKASIVEYVPKLKGVEIPGWGGKKWDEAPGGYHPSMKVIVFATNPDMKPHGSGSLGDHEIGHAYDEASGFPSRTAKFLAAFQADRNALRQASPSGYYSSEDKGKTTTVRAQGEAFAESFSAYYSNNAKWFADKPALLNYFRSMPPPKSR